MEICGIQIVVLDVNIFNYKLILNYEIKQWRVLSLINKYRCLLSGYVISGLKGIK